MKKIKIISLIVLSIALLGLWSYIKAQSIEDTADESQSEKFIPEIDAAGAEDYLISDEEMYNEFLDAFQPWTSRTLAP